MVCRNSANSDRYHHLSGCVSVAASRSPRTLGNSAFKAAGLRIMRKLLRKTRKKATHSTTTSGFTTDHAAGRFTYECATVITTFPFLCPRSTCLKASAIRSNGKLLSITALSLPAATRSAMKLILAGFSIATPPFSF